MDDDYTGYSSDEGEYIYEEPEMMPEMGAFQRAGGTGILGSKIDTSELKGKKMEEIAKKLSRISMSPEERLRIYVEAMSYKLADDKVVNVIKNIDEMLSYISNLSKPAYINPIGFIMGYVASNGGKDMDISRVKATIKSAEKLHNEGGFSPYDVLRYAKLWVNLTK